jgi:hypothetical protein
MYIKPSPPLNHVHTGTELSEQELFSQTAAHWLCARGWGESVGFVLAQGQPLAFLAGQLLWVAQPALGLLGGAEVARRWALLLEDTTAVSQLCQQINTLTAKQNSAGKETP